MKLRVHYNFGIGKVRHKTFVLSDEEFDLTEYTRVVGDNRSLAVDGMVTFTSPQCKGFSVPAREIVLMEVID